MASSRPGCRISMKNGRGIWDATSASGFIESSQPKGIGIGKPSGTPSGKTVHEMAGQGLLGWGGFHPDGLVLFLRIQPGSDLSSVRAAVKTLIHRGANHEKHHRCKPVGGRALSWIFRCLLQGSRTNLRRKPPYGKKETL